MKKSSVRCSQREYFKTDLEEKGQKTTIHANCKPKQSEFAETLV